MFTRAPTPFVPSVVRREVSGINAIVKYSGVTDAIVRLTPSIATKPFSTMKRVDRGRTFDRQPVTLALDRLADDRRGRIDVSVDEMAAQAVAQAQRELDVDRIAFAQFVEAGAHDALGNDVERHRPRVAFHDGQTHAVDRDRVLLGDALGDRVGRFDREHHAVAQIAAQRRDAAEMRDQAAKHAAAVRLS